MIAEKLIESLQSPLMQFLCKELFFFFKPAFIFFNQKIIIIFHGHQYIQSTYSQLGIPYSFCRANRNDCKNSTDSSILSGSLWNRVFQFSNIPKTNVNCLILDMNWKSNEKMEIWISKTCEHKKNLLCASNIIIQITPNFLSRTIWPIIAIIKKK